MSLVFWGRRIVVVVMLFCSRPGVCPAPGRLLGCGRGPCPGAAACPLLETGTSYRWTARIGARVIGVTLLTYPIASQQPEPTRSPL